MSAHVCSLFEGTYHLGLGALVNSLYRNGFRGTVFAGYRGELPPWVGSVPLKDGIANFAAAEGCNINFILLDTTLHLANYKPILMRRVFDQFLLPGDLLCYFDPDITVKCRWSFFEEWVQYGFALVEDCTFPYMPSDHPLRYQWIQVARSAGFTQKRAPSRYYNSGFVGLPENMRHVLAIWESLTEAATDLSVAGSRPGTSQCHGDDHGCSALYLGARRHGFQWRRLRDVARGEFAEALGQRLYEIYFVGTAAEPVR
jgi:hypothetical protein